ncbi:MAG: DNA-3-methyladenine glycosylase [Candidatus Nanohaloarchaea archaeon]
MREFKLEPENFDLEQTMTCGQTFTWNRFNGDLYGEGPSRFYTFRRGEPLIVEEDNGLEVKTSLPREEVVEALGLHRDLEEVFAGFPEDEKLEAARKELWGLRVLKDEFFPTLMSYLLSPQMSIPRIKQMYDAIAKNYGEEVEVEGRRLQRFPTQEELSDATEDELRDLGVGYRAKYIVETLDRLEDFSLEELQEKDYEAAREEMKRLYGVGNKVADCVLLFSQGFHEAAPFDTWAMKAVKAHYPDLYSDSYAELSKNFRARFGKDAGYAQEYIFHAARTGVLEV